MKISPEFASRINAFKEKHLCPFTGTNNKPYNLYGVKYSSKRPCEDDIINSLPTIEEYLVTRKSPVIYKNFHVLVFGKKKHPKIIPGVRTLSFEEIILVDPKTGFAMKSNWSLYNHSLTDSFCNYLIGNQPNYVESVFYDEPMDSNISSESPGALFLNKFIINADDEGSQNVFLDNGTFNEYPCLSFKCLVNLISNKVVENDDEIEMGSKGKKILANSKVKIIDYSPAKIKHISPKLQEELSKARKRKYFDFSDWASIQTPPEPGFTLIDQQITKWHKSGTILLRNGNSTYVMGQDEGSYFGCILKDKVDNLKDAFTSLMPPEARGVKGVFRQGEWFAIPVKDQKSVPDKFSPNTILFGDASTGEQMTSLYFGIENEDSNIHTITGDVIITKDGKSYFRNFEIEHNDHAMLSGTDGVWYTFAKNTALASFSSKNVD